MTTVGIKGRILSHVCCHENGRRNIESHLLS